MNKPKIITFGEILIRLSPPSNKRFSQSPTLEIHYGGAEGNVAASLSKFGLNVEMVSALPHHEYADEAIKFLKGHNVGTKYILRQEGRMGVYFVEGANMHRGGKVIYDRTESCFTNLQLEDLDWDEIFEGATWFHWSGITPAVSENAALLCEQAILKANEMGLQVSMDYNFRAKLWKWGKSDTEVMPKLMKGCHVMSGIHPDFDVLKEEIPDEEFAKSADKLMSENPKCKIVVFSSRGVYSASHHTWQGVLYDGKKVYRSTKYELTHIVDRVGGGDAFMAGIIYGLNTSENLQEVIDFATASSTLKHGIEGDFNDVALEEVYQLMQAEGGAKVSR
ncbi:sugar kinase [Sediminitomix flava]|uniref:2-dehydro-3-deoxygluconokinase n=1 Tax=Sediminitomix flava TaxID=379075 RepID=A0A315Z4E7_SEDFL|nr:sugar kinase [Sediminitomix flava]PWJ37954.1 2-dehydro-3-deoxygluconokinase [Sediminitomix flava]